MSLKALIMFFQCNSQILNVVSEEEDEEGECEGEVEEE